MATKKQLWKKTIPGTRLLGDGAYEAILVVPPDCRQALGKKNLTKRLGKNYAEAVRRSHAVIAAFHEQIAVAKEMSTKTRGSAASLDPQTAMDAIATWRLRECKRVEERLFNEARPPRLELAKNSFLTVSEEQRLELRDALSRTSWPRVFGNRGYVDIPEFDQKLLAALAEGGVALEPGHPALVPLRPVFQSAWYDVVCHEEGLVDGHARVGALRRYGQLNAGRDEEESVRTSSTTPRAVSESPTLLAVFECWKKEHLRARRVRKTADEFETQISRFVDVVGDKPVAEISRQDVILFKERMMQYPARPPRPVQADGVEAAIAWAEANDAPLLQAKTLNEKVLASVRAVLSYARDRGNIDVNSAEHIRVKAGKEISSRFPYTEEDLKALFLSPVFLSGDRPKGGAGEAAKWLPLLAVFTGARLEELANLMVADIKQANGVDFIHFQTRSEDGSVRHLKNRYAYRKVPIHTELKRLGFLKLVAQTRERAETRLFPLLVSTGEKQSAPFSKWYGRYSRQFVPDVRKSFHSFRHTVKRVLRSAKVEKALRDAIMGHSHADEAERYGLDEDGQGFDLIAMRDAVEAIRYNNLDLSEIK